MFHRLRPGSLSQTSALPKRHLRTDYHALTSLDPQDDCRLSTGFRAHGNKGIRVRIQRTSQTITLAIAVLSVLAIGCGILSRYYRIIQEQSYEARRKMFNLTEQLAGGSDRLTAAVRAYATTGDRRYYDAFQKELKVDRNRDAAVEGLKQLDLTPEELE